MISKKRGQITVFIIIGIILLLTAFLLSYYKKEKIEETELIQPELIPIQEFVQSCTDGLAREALEIIGLNGGYIYFPVSVENNPRSYLALSPIKELKNPYWWYDGKSSIPPLEYLNKQISDYVRANIEKCIGNFSSFSNTYNVINLGGFDVITEIGEEDVLVRTIYPIEVQDKFNKTLAKLQKYIIKVPIRLKKVYELANKIMERENKDYFIEKRAIDLMTLDDKNIPTTGIEIKCGKKQWLVKNVENKLKRLLEINLPFIKIKSSKFSEDSIIPYLPDPNPFEEKSTYNASYYNYHYIWDLGDIPYSNMHVSFSYDPKWDMDFYVRPRKGQRLESNSQKGTEILSLFCMNIWHFTYDVIFPVKATIVDDKTSKNERYAFTFAFKASIDHNTPARTNFATTSFETRNVYTEEEYCQDLDKNITIHAVEDSSEGIDIRDVNITFTCGRFTCNIGKTESDWNSGGLPLLRTRFPSCVNGILRGSKEGYNDAEKFIQTEREESYNLIMQPVKTFTDYTVVKYTIIGQGISGPQKLKDDEKAMITVKNKAKKFESYAAYPLDETPPLKLLSKDDYTYELEIFVMDNETIIGGYKKNWSVGYVPLRLAKNITFNVISKEFTNEEDQYLFFAQLEENSKKVEPPELR